MLTALLVFIILCFVFGKLSKFCKKISASLHQAAASERYYKQAILEATQDIRNSACPSEEEEVDLKEKLREINGELKAREEQRKLDKEAVEKLISDQPQG